VITIPAAAAMAAPPMWHDTSSAWLMT